MEEIKQRQGNIPVKILSMDMIESQKVEWLWYPYVPYGKITIVQGDPGEGKTTMVLNLAARLSQGKHFEESDATGNQLFVIYQTAEDGLADTVKPRLVYQKALEEYQKHSGESKPEKQSLKETLRESMGTACTDG